MNQTEIFNQIKDIVIDQLDTDAPDIQLTTNFKSDLSLDSLDVFEIVDKIEDTFDVEIESDEGLATVGDLVNYVLEQKA